MESGSSDIKGYGQVGVISPQMGPSREVQPSRQKSVFEETAYYSVEGIDHAPWGKYDNEPQQLMKKYSCSSMMLPKLYERACKVYGNGIISGVYDDSGKFVPRRFEKWAKWEFLSGFKETLRKAIWNGELYANVFPELNLNKDRDKIAKIDIQPSQRQRLSKSDKGPGYSDFTYLNPDFGCLAYQQEENRKRTVPRRNVHLFYDPCETLRECIEKHSLDMKFCVPMQTPGLGTGLYYERPIHTVSITSGWLEHSIDMLDYKKCVISNQTNVSYAVYVLDEYFKLKQWPKTKGSSKCVAWDELSKRRQENIKDEITDQVNDWLCGKENKGRPMLLPSTLINGQEVEVIKIKPLENLYTKSMFIDDFQESIGHLSASLMFHADSSGMVMSSKMANGGGSDKRVAHNIESGCMQSIRHMYLQLAYLVKHVNGMDEDMVFQFETMQINTSDTGKETTTAPTGAQSGTDGGL